MLETKKFFLDYCILALTIKTITCTITKLTVRKLSKPFLTITHLGMNENLLF